MANAEPWITLESLAQSCRSCGQRMDQVEGHGLALIQGQDGPVRIYVCPHTGEEALTVRQRRAPNGFPSGDTTIVIGVRATWRATG